MTASGQAGTPLTLPEIPQLNEMMRKFQEIEATGRQERAQLAAKLDMMTKRMEKYECLGQGRIQSTARPVPVQGQEYPPSFRHATPTPQQRVVQAGTSQREFQNSVQSEARYGQGEATRPTYNCWKCGQPGHLYRNCPFPAQEGAHPPPVSQANPNNVRMTVEDLTPRQRGRPQRRQEAPEVLNTRGTYSNVESKVSVNDKQSGQSPKDLATYLKVRINGRDKECLLGSRSEVSVIPASLVSR